VSPRERGVVIICGARRKGKSTLTAALARQAFESGARGRTVIIDPGGSLGGTLPEDLDALIEAIVEDNEAAVAARRPVPTSLIIFDDADAYLPHRLKDGSAWRRLFLQSAQLDVDVIVNAKRLQDLAPQLINASTWVYAFSMPRADREGRKRVLEVLPDNEDLPQVPYEFVQVDPCGDEWHRGKLLLHDDGKSSVVLEK